ncbi:hypothetical protein PV735_05370 [Streptomyces turgidiscabies]|uniref:Uncharacterized protein n=1 Tax=Streptomyces turgidiscabies (strain Car8) TaxID=698760 RepID=L7EZ29_STRT8|nr:hypothetical protein [Streptomyces turgidiscabies]ELP64129.1 hypothetical protein STRTUCAR8_05573 [Streptomyces turgidiscabies Car8]MDX3492119.1 hypothetical protein [Streptomyces turgidiscabies]
MKRRPEDDEPLEEQTEEEAGEGDEPSGRGSLVALVVVGILVAWRIVVVFPEVAYVIVGILGTLGWQKLQAWREGRSDIAGDEEEAAQPDVVEALHRLVGDDKGVLLTVLRDDLKLPDTKAVKALLEAEGIPWKASRTREGNGPAVRAEAIPPVSSPAVDPHGGGCCCRSGGNNNGNNGDGGRPEEGLRVDRTDTGLTIHKIKNRPFGHSGNEQVKEA